VTENLVTSLRESAGWIKDVEHESWFGTADLQNDAANEIERLRAENTRLASFLHPIGATIRYDGIKDMTSEQVDQILKAIKETHRG